MMKSILQLIILGLLLPLAAKAEEDFDRAAHAAQKSDHTLALLLFDSIIQKDPSNVPAIINSGNCYFHGKDYGKAIHRYESALKLLPGDMELVRSIEACYTALGKQELYSSPFGTLEILLFKIGGLTWAILSVIMVLLLSVAVFLKVTGKGNPVLRSYAFISLCGALFIVSVYGGMRVHEYLAGKHFAIITSGTAPLLQNEQGELSGFHLTQGARVRVLRSTDGLVSIVDQSGQRYFVRATDLRRF